MQYQINNSLTINFKFVLLYLSLQLLPMAQSLSALLGIMHCSISRQVDRLWLTPTTQKSSVRKAPLFFTLKHGSYVQRRKGYLLKSWTMTTIRYSYIRMMAKNCNQFSKCPFLKGGFGQSNYSGAQRSDKLEKGGSCGGSSSSKMLLEVCC